MTNYREILRLKKLGLNNSEIAQSLGCSRTTVIQVLSVAEEKGISYGLKRMNQEIRRRTNRIKGDEAIWEDLQPYLLRDDVAHFFMKKEMPLSI